jgi:hypothetical protein
LNSKPRWRRGDPQSRAFVSGDAAWNFADPRELAIGFLLEGPDLPNEMSQFASALLTLVFAVTMLVAGQSFMRYRSAQTFSGPSYRVFAVDGTKLSPSFTPSRPQ